MIYSHGFEEIYALEKVDAGSIRQIPAEAKKEKPKKVFRASGKKQLALDFGESHRQTLPSFILTEPIQRLELSRNLETWLTSHSYLTLRDVIQSPLSDLPDGHHQEVSDKLEAYIAGRSLYDTDRVDFFAWLRGLLVGIKPIAAHVLLEEWGLEELVTLQPQERIDLRRLREEHKKERREEVAAQLRERSDLFFRAARQVADVLIRPWIRKRQGLARRIEVEEHLFAVGEDPEAARQVVALMSAIFCNGAFLLDRHLCHADYRLYSSDEVFADAYDAVIEKVSSYFYKPSVTYSLDQLETLICREIAKQWRGYPDGFVRACLRLSPQYCLRRDEKGRLMVIYRM